MHHFSSVNKVGHVVIFFLHIPQDKKDIYFKYGHLCLSIDNFVDADSCSVG